MIGIRRNRGWLKAALWAGVALGAFAPLLLAACGADPHVPPPSETAAGTPPVALDTLAVTGTSASGERLRVIMPALTLERPVSNMPVRVLVALVDPHGTYSYLLHPVSPLAENTRQISLVDHPLEVGISAGTPYVALWIVAFQPVDDSAISTQNLDALATSLALSFRSWLNTGDPADDPLAGTVGASDGALYAWFAGIDVQGQALARLDAAGGWETELRTIAAPDGGISAVFDVDYLPPTSEATPAPVRAPAEDEFTLLLDETFDDPASAVRWFQGRAPTFINEVAGSGYQIRLLGASRGSTAISWGSLSGVRIARGRIEADARLTESDAAEASYGIWLRYQDDNNFLSVSLSSQGEYRVTVVESNRVQRVIQDWQQHPAIHTGAATNTLSVELHADGRHDLAVNGVHLLTFRDRTFGEGAIAFFCAARSVPATCRLESLRVWQAAG